MRYVIVPLNQYDDDDETYNWNKEVRRFVIL